jgi:pyrimidine-nucleoside phosphorylase
MLPQEVIRKKRFGHPLSAAEISGFFGGFMRGEVADYQVAAMLMAIVLKGMDRQEAAALTLTMRDSGQRLHWGGDQSQIVDKHSTGGVGDKTSLVILPLCVLEDLRVPMIAGRGLGHTGGTLDKLEAIAGTNVFISTEQATRLLQDHGGFFMGQTDEIAPLDKKLYAMRDVTDTVESVPLITASILSKKLAEGIGCLVMDVKFGSGAFMRAKSDAMALAESIAAVGSAAGLKIRCALTDMGSPLGDRAGNTLEVIECVDILKGHGPVSTRDLSLDLAVEMAHLSRPSQPKHEIRERMLGHLSSGRAFETFAKIIKAQGGDVRLIQDVSKFKQAPVTWDVKAETDGAIVECDVRGLGLAIVELGGGRRRSSDKIDPAVGLSDLKRVGDKIARGDIIARVHAASREAAEQVAKNVANAYKIGPIAEAEPLIWCVI